MDSTILTAFIAGGISITTSLLTIIITNKNQRQNNKELEELKFQYEILKKQALIEFDKNQELKESKSIISQSIQKIKTIIHELASDTLNESEQDLAVNEIREIARAMSGRYGISLGLLSDNEKKAIHDTLIVVESVRATARLRTFKNNENNRKEFTDRLLEYRRRLTDLQDLVNQSSIPNQRRPI